MFVHEYVLLEKIFIMRQVCLYNCSLVVGKCEKNEKLPLGGYESSVAGI